MFLEDFGCGALGWAFGLSGFPELFTLIPSIFMNIIPKITIITVISITPNITHITIMTYYYSYYRHSFSNGIAFMVPTPQPVCEKEPFLECPEVLHDKVVKVMIGRIEIVVAIIVEVILISNLKNSATGQNSTSTMFSQIDSQQHHIHTMHMPA